MDYRVHVQTEHCAEDEYDLLGPTKADPAEIVSAIQVLFPNYSAIWIERVQKPHWKKEDTT